MALIQGKQYIFLPPSEPTQIAQANRLPLFAFFPYRDCSSYESNAGEKAQLAVFYSCLIAGIFLLFVINVSFCCKVLNMITPFHVSEWSLGIGLVSGLVS